VLDCGVGGAAGDPGGGAQATRMSANETSIVVVSRSFIAGEFEAAVPAHQLAGPADEIIAAARTPMVRVTEVGPRLGVATVGDQLP